MCHVTDSDLDQIVFCTTCHNATADNFLKALDATLKLLKPFSRMSIHTNRNKHSQWIAKLLCICPRMIAGDDICFLQPFDTAGARGGREVDPLSKLRNTQARLGLQQL